ncbi:hypothetical protein CTEN210_05697, partial [Chaetoceros tenuissimus]
MFGGSFLSPSKGKSNKRGNDVFDAATPISSEKLRGAKQNKENHVIPGRNLFSQNASLQNNSQNVASRMNNRGRHWDYLEWTNQACQNISHQFNQTFNCSYQNDYEFQSMPQNYHFNVDNQLMSQVMPPNLTQDSQYSDLSNESQGFEVSEGSQGLFTVIDTNQELELQNIITPTNQSQASRRCTTITIDEENRMSIEHQCELLHHIDFTNSEIMTLLRSKGFQKIKKHEIVVNAAHHERYKNNSDKHRKVKMKLKGKKSNLNNFARRILGFAVATTPKASQQSMAIASHCARMAFLHDLGIIDEEVIAKGDICNTSPAETFNGDVIKDVATDLLFRKRHQMKDPNNSVCFLGIDKGPRGDFVKVVTQWIASEKKVVAFIIDNEKAGGTNVQAAQAIEFSTKRLELGNNFRYGGFSADSGGGGTREGLYRYLVPAGILDEDALVGTCSLHCLQVLLANPSRAMIGEGGVTERNALQLIHAVYDLQKHIGVEEWRNIIKIVEEKSNKKWKNANIGVGNDEFYEKFREPILTRWWTVGQATNLIVKNLHILKDIVLYCIRMKRKDKDTAIHTTASRLYSLLHERTIISDLKFIYCYNDTFISKHFDWMQQGDERIGGTPGFYGRNMLARVFLMRQDLDNLGNDEKWKTHKGMELFAKEINEGLKKIKKSSLSETSISNVESPCNDDDNDDDDLLDGEEEEEANGLYEVTDILDVVGNIANSVPVPEGQTLENMKDRPLVPQHQVDKTNKVFKRAILLLEKHFKRYYRQHLFLGLFGEPETARIVARKIQNPDEPCADDSVFYTHACKYQGDRRIDLKAFAQFLDKYTDAEMIKNCPHIRKIGRDWIEKVSKADKSIWDEQSGHDYEEIRNFYIKNYSAWLTSTHCVEAAVKKSADADNGSRTEMRMMQYVIASNMKSDINQKTIKAKQLKKMSKGEEFKSDCKARGKELLVEINKYLYEFHNEIEEMLLRDPEARAIHERIRASFNSTHNAFSKQRII